MQVLTTLGVMYLVGLVVVKGLTITVSDTSLAAAPTTTDNPTNNMDFLQMENSLQDRKRSERKRSSQKGNAKSIKKQMKRLSKMCRPRRTPVSITEELGSRNDLLDNPSLFPKIVPVKRCDIPCNYCGQGVDLQADSRKVCTAVTSRTKNFTIQYSFNDTTVYEKVPVRVDRKCECQTAASTTTSETPQLE